MASHRDVPTFLLDGRDPRSLALRFTRGDHTYGDLNVAVDRTAEYLAALNLTRGDRVVLVGDNSFFWVAAYLAVMKAGLVSVPQPPGVSRESLQRAIEFVGAAVVVLQGALAARLGPALDHRHVITDAAISPIAGALSQQDFGAILSGSAARSTTGEPSSTDDLAALMFTSGSTGEPRCVMITHGNIIANTEAIIESLRLTSDDSIMAVLPFHYCFGASLLHTHLRAGASIVVDSRFTYPEVVLDRMSETGCTGFAGVPMHFQILLRRSSLARRRLPRLRYVQQAGGRLAPPFVVELRRALPAVQVFLMYGQTEATARLSYLPPEFVDTKPGSIGRGMKDVHLRVLTEDGVDVQPGQIGEIVATGRSIAQGYWQERESTATPFRNGALNTGDLATVDDDGFIYIVDRRSDFVKCRGERVSCRSVEDILIASDELAEAAVVGVDDPVLGEALKAFVVPRSDRSRDGTVERLKAFCRTRLPLHLVPQEFVVLDALPKYDTGKIAKSRLKLEHTTATTVEADMNELS